MGPFKCPDCGVWWAGFEHVCRPSRLANTVNPQWEWGHCHGCSSMYCTAADDKPCMIHKGGYTISGSDDTNSTQWDPVNKVSFNYT